MHRKKISRLRVVDLPVEGKKVSALADWAHDVRHGGATGWIHRLDPVERVVVGWSEKISHARVGDDELLAAASLSVEHAGQEDAGVADEETARLEDDLLSPEPPTSALITSPK